MKTKQLKLTCFNLHDCKTKSNDIVQRNNVRRQTWYITSFINAVAISICFLSPEIRTVLSLDPSPSFCGINYMKTILISCYTEEATLPPSFSVLLLHSRLKRSNHLDSCSRLCLHVLDSLPTSANNHTNLSVEDGLGII